MPTKPERLRPGDTIAIVAPASAPPDEKSIDLSVALLEKLGFKVKEGLNVRKRHGFLAGSDEHRASDLMDAFVNPKIKAIFCVRGGYGSARLLAHLDFELIRKNPKIFVGYSDLTWFHCACLTKADLVTFHGPMLNSDLIKEDLPEFTLNSLFKTLQEPTAPLRISASPDGQAKVLKEGRASGPLVGGNLSVLCTTIGTPAQPSFENALLFLEDVDEPPYRFDRMLTHLLNAGVLNRLNGVAIGTNKNCEDPKRNGANEYRQSLEDVLKERLGRLGIPIVTGLPFGHVQFNATLPVGLMAELDGIKGELILTEPGVK
jgi:muramoyltetrapeptide carboxypeptidase